MSYRVEEKFRLQNYELTSFKYELLGKGMTGLFAARIIESTYCDNGQMGMYRDSEEGALPRKKVRLRHYPGSEQPCKLEIKTSSIEGRYKRSHALSDDRRANLLAVGIVDSIYGVCKPVVTIRYKREYYMYGNIRITFDTGIEYIAYRSKLRRLEPECVAEIKAPGHAPLDALRASIGFQRSRFSKYSRACQAVLGITVR